MRISANTSILSNIMPTTDAVKPFLRLLHSVGEELVKKFEAFK